MAFVFIFNLLLGAGVLSLPSAFAAAGWIASTVLLCVLCFARLALFTLPRELATNHKLDYVIMMLLTVYYIPFFTKFRHSYYLNIK